MAYAAVTDVDLHLLRAERAGIELEGFQRLSFGGRGVGFEFGAHDLMLGENSLGILYQTGFCASAALQFALAMWKMVIGDDDATLLTR